MKKLLFSKLTSPFFLPLIWLGIILISIVIPFLHPLIYIIYAALAIYFTQTDFFFSDEHT